VNEQQKAKILVVDDDIGLLELLVETLSTVGYKAIGAAGGVEALQKLQEEKFSLMITDIKMPDVDGLQLLRKVRRHYSRMPVLFITGVASADIIGQAAPDGFLAKPFRISQIEKLIEHALEHKSGEFSSLMRKVLIVDGDEEFRTTLSDALSFSQYIPFHVSAGKAALKELEHGSMDAVITDYQLPDMDGITLLNSIKKHYPDVLAILTGSPTSPDDLRSQGQAASADAFLSKPFRASEFLDLLHQHGIGSAVENN